MEFKLRWLKIRIHVENLWAYCFEQRKIHSFNIILQIAMNQRIQWSGLEQDQLLSTVHLRQYNLNVRGAVLPTSYMVGVATCIQQPAVVV